MTNFTTTRMLAANPYQQFACGSGVQYTADAEGFIQAASNADVVDLLKMGCQMSALKEIGRLIGANMNITTDQPFVMAIPPTVPYKSVKITATNASASLTTAVGGVYDAASKGGNAIVAATQAYSGLTAANKTLDLTMATVSLTLKEPAGTGLILALTTAQGGAATADLYAYGDVYN